MVERMAVHAIITGGGSGSRMKNPVNKSFILLSGKPIIAYSMQLFQQHPDVSTITIIMHPEWVQETTQWMNQLGITKVKQIVEGGKERQDSVRNGLNALAVYHPKPDDVVLVHNAANPLLTRETISECIHAAQQNQASVAGYRVKDTIKRVGDDGKIIETLKRNELWGMQTPQCIQYALFVRASDKAAKDSFLGTDDVQLVERLGVKPVVVDCGYENFKITTPEDVSMAERILEKRRVMK
jgi:2-C-methyl-D-erythritol 4-phosphate cytidylyltransferase